MAHHKRRRPKHQRSGCLSCKSYKDERAAKVEAHPPRERRKLQDDETGRMPGGRRARGD